jgi:hypothetical protein
MGLLTKYTNLPDADLIRQLEEARLHSPIIEELCLRLEVKPPEYDGYQTSVTCPVCEASLNVKEDNADKTFSLETQ